MIKKKDINFEALSPNKLFSDDGADKVMAILAIMANPTKYKQQMSRIKKTLEANQAILDDIKTCDNINKAQEDAQKTLTEVKKRLSESDKIIEGAQASAKSLRDEADAYYRQTKQDVHRYANRVKEQSKELALELKTQKAVTKSLSKKEKEVDKTLQIAQANRQEYEHQLKELKSRFEGLKIKFEDIV